MSDVEIGYGDSAQDTAILLLAAVEDLDLDPSVVRTTEGKFIAPEEVAKKAGLIESDDKKPSPRKATAPKAAAKKSATTDEKDD